MSTESAKAFIERAKTDEAFAKRVSELKNFAEVSELAVKAGYQFTEEEMDKATGELSDHALESVAGGTKYSCIFQNIT